MSRYRSSWRRGSGITSCRRGRRSRTVEGCQNRMSSFPYLAPPIPRREILMDMIVWYTSQEKRREVMAEGWDLDQTPLDDLVDQATTLLETWQPTSDYHWTVVRKGRVLDWLVWQTALAADESWRAAYQDIEMIEPWAIRLDTLPPYGLMPTALGEPD